MGVGDGDPGSPCSRANAAACSLPLPTQPGVVPSTQSTERRERAPSARRAGASRGTGRTGAGSRRGRPARGPPAIVSTARQPGRDRPARGRAQIRSPSAVLTSSPTMTVSPAGRRVARRERAVDPVVVGDREVGQPARGRGPHDDRRAATASRTTPEVWQCRSTNARAASGPADRRDPAQICWTSDFLKKSKCSSARPVPRATQLSGFSATWHGHAGHLGQQLVDVAQQRAAAGHDHALVDDVARRAPAASARARCGPRRRAAGAAPRSPP